MRTELQQITLKGITDAGTDDAGRCDCGWSGRHGFAYMELLHKEKLGPLEMHNTALSQVLKQLGNMDNPTIPRT